MQSKIIITNDNSKTLLIPSLNETYHSTKGALTESRHIFIDAGIKYLAKNELKIFEMGFGTGLNALLSLDLANQNTLQIIYDSIEAYPISIEQAKEMDYPKISNLTHLNNNFIQMHNIGSAQPLRLSENFLFTKYIDKIENFNLKQDYYNLIFYDAFAPSVQAELWEKDILKKLYESLSSKGVLVTYCAQGAFKRNLKAVGFNVHAIAGPPGKREMTRAIKD